ncbi:hypothetical protein ACTXT7_002624 [Hymenolepis weldensis]
MSVCGVVLMRSGHSTQDFDSTILDDETRVLLESKSTGDYINANYVKVNEVPSRRYILTQGPLLQTVGHFWQMIWEQKSPVIIMLNRFTEKGTLKCFNYFPLNSQQTLTFPDSSYSVTCISEENKGLYALRSLEVVNNNTKEIHQILHFHYTRWPDFGVPDYSSSMLNLLWDVRRTGALDDPDRPAIIHCSAGVGRSGTFVLIDLALTMEHYGDKWDVIRVVTFRGLLNLWTNLFLYLTAKSGCP